MCQGTCQGVQRLVHSCMMLVVLGVTYLSIALFGEGIPLARQLIHCILLFRAEPLPCLQQLCQAGDLLLQPLYHLPGISLLQVKKDDAVRMRGRKA